VDSCLTRPQAGVPLAVLTSFLAAAGRGRERGREGGATAGRPAAAAAAVVGGGGSAETLPRHHPGGE